LKALEDDRVRVMREFSQPEYALNRRLMTVSGMEEVLGGPAAADAALRALMAETMRVLTTETDARARRIANVDVVDGVAPVVGGYVELAAFFRELNDFYGSGDARSIPSKSEHGYGSRSIEGGSVGYESTTEVDSHGVSSQLKTRMKINACPNAQGEVILEIDQESRMSAGGRGSNVNAHARVVRRLTDDADYGTVESDMRIQSAVFGPKAGTFVDVTRRISTVSADRNAFIVNRQSSQATSDDVDYNARILEMLEVLALSFTEKAREVWESGACVTLEPTSTPAKRTGVRPSTSFSVNAAPRSKLDGSPTGGTVRARLSGASTVDPANTPVRADATFTYVAPGEKDKDASVYFEARSRRGIGKAHVPFDTRLQAYSVEGGADEFHGTGVACSLGSEFTVRGSGVTVTFTPSGAQGGKYSYTGNMGGFPVWGNGTYTVNYQDEKAVSIHATGPGSVKTPKGTYTRGGSETYTLTPHEGDCGG
jgi:hypothetical protein